MDSQERQPIATTSSVGPAAVYPAASVAAAAEPGCHPGHVERLGARTPTSAAVPPPLKTAAMSASMVVRTMSMMHSTSSDRSAQSVWPTTTWTRPDPPAASGTSRAVPARGTARAATRRDGCRGLASARRCRRPDPPAGRFRRRPPVRPTLNEPVSMLSPAYRQCSPSASMACPSDPAARRSAWWSNPPGDQRNSPCQNRVLDVGDR